MYLVLGMILDGISIVVMTLPIVLPMVLAAGFDPIWFGVFLVIMVELSQITPPVGFSLFVIQGISQEPVSAIIKATVPFFMLMILAVILISIWPDIVMFLPDQMSK
jgi:TRAP-type C4-dicarboxylate transport system permease large subunit